jgi:Mrp family chromosome partitioning ATPase
VNRPMADQSADRTAANGDDDLPEKWSPPWTRRETPARRESGVVSFRTASPAAIDQESPGERKHVERQLALDVGIGDDIVHHAPASVAAPLRYFLAGIDLPHRVGVSACTSGEGVTSLSRTMAALVAHDWRASTCWIDLNWWKPATVATDSDPFEFTIVDALTGETKASNLPTPTSNPNLWMVAAGEVAASSRAQLPRSELLWQVVDEVASEFDHVVIDLPPILETADAVALGRFCDAYALVVRQHAVSSGQVRTALRTMTTVPCIGIVLNGAHSKVPRWLRSSSEGRSAGIGA